MLVPQVVGFRLTEPARGRDRDRPVLTVTQILRQTGVVGKFVEYFGHGLAGLPLADRATIGNMSPEYGATCGFFPVDEETLRYLRLTGRSEQKVALVEAYCRENGLWHDPDEQPTTPRWSTSTSRAWSRRWPARAGRRTGFRCTTRATRSSRRSPPSGSTGDNGADRRGRRGVDGGERPARGDGTARRGGGPARRSMASPSRSTTAPS